MFLIVIKGSNVGNVFSLNKLGRISIGRSKSCDIQLLDLMISREHCHIENRSTGFYIKDLGSTNKTTVNKKVISAEEKLSTGDIIELGDTVLLFTSREEIPIQSVEDFAKMKMSKTRSIDAQSSE